MVAMTKRVKSFQIVMDPVKTFYCGGDKVCGQVEVEVNEVTHVSAVKVLGLGRAKVEYPKGKQRCRQEDEYLRYEEVLKLDEQPTGTDTHHTITPCSQICCPFQIGTSVIHFSVSRQLLAKPSAHSVKEDVCLFFK